MFFLKGIWETDLYSLQDLINSADNGAQKKEVAEAKIEALKAVLPQVKRGELDGQKKKAHTDWQSLVKSMQNTQ